MNTRPVHLLLFALLVVSLSALVVLPSSLTSRPTLALNDGLARTPPMGWNSWNRFGCNVSESLIMATADAMVASGMRDAGYQYVVIDDCWQVARGPDGTIIADPERFPSGIAALARYVHDRGLKFGLYTDAGSKTCMGRPGSLGYEWQDAFTYAAWGVDYVKIDWCHTDGQDAPTSYARFRDAFAATGRPVVLSICTWGYHEPWDWGPETGHLWRTTRDIADSWPVLLEIIDESARRAYAAGPGAWNDPDMLEVGNGGMTDVEYRTHFSLWAMMAAPLIAGNDLTQMSAATRAILLNHEVIAVDQDPLGVQALIVHADSANRQVWSRPLAQTGAWAAALFNPTDAPAVITARWSDIGLPPGAATVRDLWAHADLGVFTDSFTATVEPHGVVMLKVVAAPAPALQPAPLPVQPAPSPAPPIVSGYLSDQPWTAAYSAFGPVERDRSNGEAAAGDGGPLTLGGVVYARGLGVHAPAEVRYNLGGACTEFAADVGIDGEVGPHGAAAFQVWADGRLLYDSGGLTGGMPPVPVYLNVAGVDELRLVVAPAGATTDYAHANWADARVWCGP